MPTDYNDTTKWHIVGGGYQDDCPICVAMKSLMEKRPEAFGDPISLGDDVVAYPILNQGLVQRTWDKAVS